MKVILILIFCLLSLNIIAQNNSSIIGNWTIVSMNRDGIYYNFKNDSISYSKTPLKINAVSDTVQMEYFAEAMRAIASQFRFELKPDTKFKFIMDSVALAVIGNYKNNSAEKVITLSNVKSVGLNDFGITNRIKYKIVEGLLYLSIDNDDEDFEFVLERK